MWLPRNAPPPFPSVARSRIVDCCRLPLLRLSVAQLPLMATITAAAAGLIITTTSPLSLSLSLSLRLLLLRILVIWRRKRNKFEATPEASAFASSIQSNGALPVSERGQRGSREIYSAPLLIGIRLRPDHPRVCLGASRRFIFNGNVESPIRDPVSHPR